jgi:hypothetical protein
VVGPPAGDLDVVVVEAEDRRHGARLLHPRLVHRFGPLAHQAHAVVEGEGTGRHQRGVLAQAVTGEVGGVDAEALHGVEDHEAGEERRELRVPGVLQLLGVGVEQEPGEVAVGHRRRLLHQLPAVVAHPGSSHAGALRALAGKGEREHPVASLLAHRCGVHRLPRARLGPGTVRHRATRW